MFFTKCFIFPACALVWMIQKKYVVLLKYCLLLGIFRQLANFHSQYYDWIDRSEVIKYHLCFYKDKKYTNVHPNVDKYKLWNVVEYEHFKHGFLIVILCFANLGIQGRKCLQMLHLQNGYAKEKLLSVFVVLI